jgi:membrane fusion protein (multidrug efflux system)
MKVTPIPFVLLATLTLGLSACHEPEARYHEEHHKIVVTSPVAKDVTSTQQYVCQVHSRRHIEVRALETGYLEEIPVKEGQTVKQGDLLFQILPTLYQAKLASEAAEAQLAQIEFNNTKKLYEENVVSVQELALAEAKLAKTKAMVALAQAELNFTKVKAPFDGIIDRLHNQHGSLIEEGDILTTLSDNDVMWVYFNVPEARYFEYQADLDRRKSPDAIGGEAQDAEASDNDDDDSDEDTDEADDVDDRDDLNDDDRADRAENAQSAEDSKKAVDDGEVTAQAGGAAERHREIRIELKLANGKIFPQPGEIAAIEADFNNETGNIAFRADFANPTGLLRHGQTGTILIHRMLDDAIVIPQRASFEILDRRYVFVVGDDQIVRQREIVIEHEMEDIYVIREGLGKHDKIVLEGIRQVRDGEHVEYEFRDPIEVLSDLKHEAE